MQGFYGPESDRSQVKNPNAFALQKVNGCSKVD
jgi:hypothetical protein